MHNLHKGCGEMEWHHFHYFQVLAETEHMTKAAERLSVSQSALSRSIAKLEEELGCTLFERRGRTIQLNKYGRAFLKRANTIVREMEASKEELQEMMGIERGVITLGFLHTLGSTYLPKFIQAFKKEYPHIRLTLIQNNSHVLLTLLKQGKLDICLTALLQVNEERIHWTPLIKEQLYVTVPYNHPFVKQQNINVSDMKDETMIVLKEGFSLRNTTNTLFERASISPVISFEGEEIQTIASLVAVGLGISILPPIKNAKEMGIVQIPVNDEDQIGYREIGLLWDGNVAETRLLNEVKRSLIAYFQRERTEG